MPTVVQSIPHLRSGRWSLKFERKKEFYTNLKWTMISEDLEGLFGAIEIVNPPGPIGLTDTNGQELPSIHYRINDVGFPGRRDQMGVARRCGDVAISGVGERYRHQWYTDTISGCNRLCAKTFEITTTRTQAVVPDHDHNLQQGYQEIQFSERQHARLKGSPKNMSLKMPTVVQSIPRLRSGR